jgi:hypothetical protein
VLCEVLVDELGEGRDSTDPASAAQLLERLLECCARVLLSCEATSLRTLAISSADPVAVGQRGMPCAPVDVSLNT